jgi:hypothetical protein
MKRASQTKCKETASLTDPAIMSNFITRSLAVDVERALLLKSSQLTILP